MSNITLSTDIYDIASSVEEVKAQYIDEDEETLAVDIYGYLGAIETRKIQSSIMVASELSNELFAQRAKYKRNLISHAITLNIEGINAIPAIMDVYISLQYQDILDNLNVDGTFILDKTCPFNIGDCEFHVVYDVLIRRSVVKTGVDSYKEVFTAQYIIDHENPNLDINNPYLNPPLVVILDDGYKYLMVNVRLTQMTYKTEYTSIITNSIIENKMSTFEFDDQLAYFEVFVNEKDYVTPIFEGSAVPDGVETFCYYTYMNDNTIRVKFDRSSYSPKLNDSIKMNIYTTKGKDGNFKYKDGKVVIGSLESKTYGYSSIDYKIHPLSDSLYGNDMKTKEELRKIIPKEALMKGIISTTDDLNNYFNMVNTEDIVLRAQKKIDNQTERTFYTYFVMKDSANNVVPTNTLSLYADLENLKIQELQDNTRYIIPSGTVLIYDKSNDRLYIKGDVNEETSNVLSVTDLDNIVEVTEVEDDNSYDIYPSPYGNLNDPENFVYISPFTIIINDSPLYMQYYLTKINQNPYLDFKFINLNSPLSFIASTAKWYRNFYSNNDIYNLELSITQNTTDEELKLIETKELVPEADEPAESETINLYDVNMDSKFYHGKTDITDYSDCFGRYYISKISLNSLNTSINTQIDDEDEFIPNLSDPNNVYKALSETVYASQTVSLYYVYRSSLSYYPCKIGTMDVTVDEKIEVFKEETDTDKITTIDFEINGNVTIQEWKDDDDNVFKRATYFHYYSAPEYNLASDEFAAVIFNGYMILDNEVDVIVNPNGSIDNLFYDTLTEAVANTLTGDDEGQERYVYTRHNGDPLLIGTIEVSKTDTYETTGALSYKWKSTNFEYSDTILNMYKNYMITNFKYNVWDYVDSEYNYYNTLKKAVADGRYTNKDTCYVYIKNTTSDGRQIEHPVYLGKVIVNSISNRYHLYLATIKFEEQMELYKNTYDDYREFYYVSNMLTNVIDETEYQNSLFDAILAKKKELKDDIYYVYTRNNTTDINPPILMGTIQLENSTAMIKGRNRYVCNYTWKSQEDYEIISKVKVLALFYKNGDPYRWIDLGIQMSSSDITTSTFNFVCNLKSLETSNTEVAFDLENNICIDGSYLTQTYAEKSIGYFNANTDLDIYVFAKLTDENGNTYPYTGNLNTDYPGVNPEIYFTKDIVGGYTLCNIYKVPNGVNFYENYGGIMNSVVTPVESEDNEGTTAGFSMSSVPVIGYRYSTDEEQVSEVIDSIALRKAYIDNVLERLENTIGIDFKFFNTFGPSKTFTLDQDSRYIDRVNMSLHFRVKLSEYNDEQTVGRIKTAVKEYIENLNYVDSEHISILITQINTDFEQEIAYFDFIGFNEYGSDELHIYRDPDEDIEIKTAPELLCVHNKWNSTTQAFEPDIDIEVIRPY